MTLNVFMTGATGFVGAAILAELATRRHSTVALSRSHELPGARTIIGDLFDAEALARGMAGCDAVIHLVGIIAERPSRGVTFDRIHVEGTRRVLAAAKEAGVKRYLHMSALGTRADAVSEYHRTKWEAVQLVRGSSLEWTIFRPSMIHGPRGEFMQMAAGWARGKKAPYLFMPYFGRGVLGMGGAGRLQPIHVADVARAFVDALNKPETVGQVYEIGGAEVVTWPGMLRAIAREVRGREKAAVGLPAWYAKLLSRVVPRSLLPFNRDQVVMSQEENTCDLSHFRRDFGWEPAGFVETLKRYAREL